MIAKYYETGKSPLPCTALSSSCFIDAYWNLYPCSIWDEKIGNLREAGFDLQAMWDGQRRRELRDDVVGERCSHCWTPCEAYPTILGNLFKATTSVAQKTPEPAGASRSRFQASQLRVELGTSHFRIGTPEPNLEFGIGTEPGTSEKPWNLRSSRHQAVEQ